MIPSRLDSDWFHSPLPETETPWLLRSTDLSSPYFRDACLGNGLIGTRLDAWGTGSDYFPGSTSFMSGLWGKAQENPERPQGLIELPHWATLNLSTGDRELRRGAAELSDHEQSLDLRHATLRTQWSERGVDGSLHQRRRAWISYARPHIAVMEAELETGEDYNMGRIFVDEQLSALHNEGVSASQTRFEDGDACMELRFEPFGHRLVIRSRILLGEATCFREQNCADSRVLQRLLFVKAGKGQQIQVTKVVAIVSSKQHADPEAEAKAQLDAACADLSSLRREHEAAWEQLWESRVESDHPRFQQLCNSSLYHLYSTMRPDQRESHGPCGLFGNGWDNNVFWDTDLWTHPALTLFNPGMGRSVAAYRYDTLAGAKRNAVDNDEVGARYAWQSGETGDEACSMRVFQDERHITSCVAMGQWLYALSAGDQEWLKQEGLEVFRACAEYWAGKAERDESDGSYHINNICGSDEHAGYVDDNATTNWGATWTLRKAAELSRAAGLEVPDLWEEVADGLVILMDEERDIPLQMKSWEHGTVIKQADTTMLVHPWHYPMDAERIEKTVDYYREHYQDKPIMMGYAIDGILDCRLGRQEQVSKTLELLVPYFRAPYLCTTEAVTNERLCFVTGMGGLLQFVAMGMAGLITDDAAGLRSDWACLPEFIQNITLHGIHHGGSRHQVQVSREGDQVSTQITALESSSN